jgi:transposase
MMVRYVGVDIGKGKCRAAFVGEDGVLINEFGFVNEFSGIECFVREFSEGDCVVMESTGNLWFNLFEGC